MHCLHITNDYSGSTVYSKLLHELDMLGAQLTIYNPIREDSKIGKNAIDFNNKRSKILYRPILGLYTRINYKYKIRLIKSDIEENVDLSAIDVIHAHTWFSDGGVAYELFKKYNIPYIVTVRSTDIVIFFKYLIHLRSYGLNILHSAQHIIFITPSLLSSFDSLSIFKRNQSLRIKSMVIPNGVDDFWIKNIKDRKAKSSLPLKMIYIGTFIRRKKLINIIKAVKIINEESLKCHLSIVGGGGNLEKEVLKSIDKHEEYFTYHGKITNRNELKNIIADSDVFIMPSKNETFGLVYIEALSQGIPIIYSFDDGIFGLHENNIGEAIDGDNINEIVKAITMVSKDYQLYDFIPDEIIQIHNWKLIAKQYFQIYENCTNNIII